MWSRRRCPDMASAAPQRRQLKQRGKMPRRREVPKREVLLIPSRQCRAVQIHERDHGRRQAGYGCRAHHLWARLSKWKKVRQGSDGAVHRSPSTTSNRWSRSNPAASVAPTTRCRWKCVQVPPGAVHALDPEAARKRGEKSNGHAPGQRTVGGHRRPWRCHEEA